MVAQSIRAVASHAGGGAFESQPRQTLVIKAGSDSSIVKRSATGECHESSEMTNII